MILNIDVQIILHIYFVYMCVAIAIWAFSVYPSLLVFLALLYVAN